MLIVCIFNPLMVCLPQFFNQSEYIFTQTALEIQENYSRNVTEALKEKHLIIQFNLLYPYMQNTF